MLHRLAFSIVILSAVTTTVYAKSLEEILEGMGPPVEGYLDHRPIDHTLLLLVADRYLNDREFEKCIQRKNTKHHEKIKCQKFYNEIKIIIEKYKESHIRAIEKEYAIYEQKAYRIYEEMLEELPENCRAITTKPWEKQNKCDAIRADLREKLYEKYR